MATYDVKQALDNYFQTNWSTTGIQYEGYTKVQVAGLMVESDTLDDFISLMYIPVENVLYGCDGTSTGRIEYAGLYKIFCYAKNPVKAYILADAVKTFLNGKEIGDIVVEVGQDSGAIDLDNGFHEVPCSFDVSQWS